MWLLSWFIKRLRLLAEMHSFDLSGVFALMGANCHVVRPLSQPVMRPMWPGPEACEPPCEWAWRWILPQWSLEMTVTLINNLTVTLWEAFRQKHPAKSCPYCWPMGTVRWETFVVFSSQFGVVCYTITNNRLIFYIQLSPLYKNVFDSCFHPHIWIQSRFTHCICWLFLDFYIYIFK